MFTISVTLGIIGLILTRFVPASQLQTHAPLSDERTKEGVKTFFNGLVEKRALFPSILAMLIGVTYGGIVSFITLFGQEVGIENVGWFFLANAFILAVTRPVAGKLFDNKGHHWVLYPGIVLAGLGLFSLSITDSTGWLVLSAILYGAGFGAIQPSLQAWAINNVPVQRRGAANGTFFSAFDLGIGLGAVILGAVANVSSYATMYGVSIIIIILLFTVYSYYIMKNKQKIVKS